MVGLKNGTFLEKSNKTTAKAVVFFLFSSKLEMKGRRVAMANELAKFCHVLLSSKNCA
jgi:hypothetical protein